MEKAAAKITKGEIKYQITHNLDGTLAIAFEDSPEKSLVIFCACEHLSSALVEGLDEKKNSVKLSQEKKHLKSLRDKAQAVSFGAKMIIDYIQPFYDKFNEEK